MSHFAMAIVRNATQLENQTPLKIYADRREPCTAEKLLDKKIQSQKEECARKVKESKNRQNLAVENLHIRLTIRAPCWDGKQ